MNLRTSPTAALAALAFVLVAVGPLGSADLAGYEPQAKVECTQTSASAYAEGQQASEGDARVSASASMSGSTSYHHAESGFIEDPPRGSWAPQYATAEARGDGGGNAEAKGGTPPGVFFAECSADDVPPECDDEQPTPSACCPPVSDAREHALCVAELATVMVVRKVDDIVGSDVQKFLDEVPPFEPGEPSEYLALVCSATDVHASANFMGLLYETPTGQLLAFGYDPGQGVETLAWRDLGVATLTGSITAEQFSLAPVKPEIRINLDNLILVGAVRALLENGACNIAGAFVEESA